MSIKIDPRTGMYIVPEIMGGGDVPQPHNFRPSPQPQGEDTVRADLTPGEAVIPAPVAQDPEFKPAIAEMVAEGRDRNAMRQGTTDVPGMMGGGMVPGYNEGTVEVDEDALQRLIDDPTVPDDVRAQAQQGLGIPPNTPFQLELPPTLAAQRDANVAVGIEGQAAADTAAAAAAVAPVVPRPVGHGRGINRKKNEWDKKYGDEYDASGAKLVPAEGVEPVEPRPPAKRNNQSDRSAWDAANEATHNKDGSPKRVPYVAPKEEVPGGDGGDGDTPPTETPEPGGIEDTGAYKTLPPEALTRLQSDSNTPEPQRIAARDELIRRKGIQTQEEMTETDKEASKGVFSKLLEGVIGEAPKEDKSFFDGLLTFVGAVAGGLSGGAAIALAVGVMGSSRSEGRAAEAEATQEAATAQAEALKPDYDKPIDLISHQSKKQVTGFAVPGTDKYQLSDGSTVSRSDYRKRGDSDSTVGSINHLRVQGGWSGGVQKKDKKGNPIFSSDGQPVYESAYDSEELLSDWVTYNEQAVGADGKRLGERGARLAASAAGQSKLRDIAKAAKAIYQQTGEEITNFAGLFEANEIGVNVNNRDRLITEDNKLVDTDNFTKIREQIDANNAKRRANGQDHVSYRQAMSVIDAALDTDDDAKAEYQKWLASDPVIPKGSTPYLEYVKLQVKLNGDNI